MNSSNKAGFCKNEDCPTSHDLLEFQRGESLTEPSRKIGKHLTVCEFCEAEVAFYSHYPQADATFETPELTAIPAPLFQLAEAILKNRHDPDALNALLKENEEFIIDSF